MAAAAADAVYFLCLELVSLSPCVSQSIYSLLE